ncbi:MAG: hypothetical protein AUI93_04465 [Crenarchaeota archaeon 13_1_40CM_3_52_10]|nr:MAG: hypothetical protein AUI93_04465 [Crenarchaeota archaeon 13_1_40CM_3_52_10]OLE91499.1 MAG: hypothetical protein AUF79_04145 [Crenarchaeota archaeon 13_1_20CM_2_51_8]
MIYRPSLVLFYLIIATREATENGKVTNISPPNSSPASLAFALAARRNIHIHIFGLSKATQEGTTGPIDFLHCNL